MFFVAMCIWSKHRSLLARNDAQYVIVCYYSIHQAYIYIARQLCAEYADEQPDRNETFIKLFAYIKSKTYVRLCTHVYSYTYIFCEREFAIHIVDCVHVRRGSVNETVRQLTGAITLHYRCRGA